MNRRRIWPLALFAIAAAAVVVLFWLRREQPRGSAAARMRVPAAAKVGTASGPGSEHAQVERATVRAAARAAVPLAGESHMADELNAPGGTIQRDLQILGEVFEMWQTNFPREGNPVGLNAEITAALTGDNVHRFAFIAPTHRAIDAAGELCDRWGTPFRFHQISGRQMEIRSAGPDRKFGTGDDVALGASEVQRPGIPEFQRE